MLYLRLFFHYSSTVGKLQRTWSLSALQCKGSIVIWTQNIITTTIKRGATDWYSHQLSGQQKRLQGCGHDHQLVLRLLWKLLCSFRTYACSTILIVCQNYVFSRVSLMVPDGPALSVLSDTRPSCHRWRTHELSTNRRSKGVPTARRPLPSEAPSRPTWPSTTAHLSQSTSGSAEPDSRDSWTVSAVIPA